PIPRHRLFDLLRTFESDDLITGDQLDARLPMDSGHELSHFRAEDRLERSTAGQDGAHPNAQLGQRSGNLRTDEAHPDQQRSGPMLGGLFDRVAVSHRPELEDARQLRTGDVQAPVLTTRRDQEAAVRNSLPTSQLDATRADVK